MLAALLALSLLLDAFAKENAYELKLACFPMFALLGAQLAVYLVGLQLWSLVLCAPFGCTAHAPMSNSLPSPMQATLQGRGDGAAAAALAVCLALLAACAAVARPAYLSFGWRMYSHIAASWRLKPAEQQRLRAAALARQRFAALAKLDASLLVLLAVVASVNAANPSSGDAQRASGPVGLLIGAAAALPLCAGWLACCWAAALGRSPRRQLAQAVDLAYPLCYVPPLLIIFTGGWLCALHACVPHKQL